MGIISLVGICRILWHPTPRCVRIFVQILSDNFNSKRHYSLEVLFPGIFIAQFEKESSKTFLFKLNLFSNIYGSFKTYGFKFWKVIKKEAAWVELSSFSVQRAALHNIWQHPDYWGTKSKESMKFLLLDIDILFFFASHYQQKITPLIYQNSWPQCAALIASMSWSWEAGCLFTPSRLLHNNN